MSAQKRVRRPEWDSHSRFARRLAVFTLAIVILAVTGCNPPQGSLVGSAVAQQSDPRAGKIEPSVNGPVPLTAIGQTFGYNTVSVRAQVDGQLINVAFHEGQIVSKGELLAEIEPQDYRLSLEEATANRDKDSAQLADSTAILNRSKMLYSDGIISKADYEKEDATFREQRALVRSDEVSISRASLALDHTRIVAPISGRVGLRSVDVGNMVHAADSSGIVTITQIQPITVIVSIPPDRLNRLLTCARQRALSIRIASERDEELPERGQIVTADTAIESVTGAARVKVVFPNTKELLWPNEYVRVVVHWGAGCAVKPT